MVTRSTQRWMPTHKLTCSKPTKIPISSLHQKVMVVQPSQLVWHLIQQLELSAGLVGRVGGTSNTTFRNFNYATQGKRSPGSTIKPLVVYAPALASGWSINKDLPNKPIDYNGYTPTNYGDIETEDIPMYQALANSYNVPAVYLFNQIGIQKGLVMVKNSVSTLTMFQKNWEFHLVVV